MIRFSLILLLLALVNGCKPLANQSDLAAEQSNRSSDEISIALSRPLPAENQALLAALTEGRGIKFRTLEKAATRLNSFVSPPVKYNKLRGSSGRVRSRNRNKPNYNDYWGYDSYRGVRIGDRVFIFKLALQNDKFYHYDRWFVHSWVSASILNDPKNGKYTGTSEQVKYYLDTKIYEPKRIAAMNKFLDNVEFAARFIPGYAGAENAFLGEKTSDRVLGVIQIVGDIASLGIGTSVKVVSRAATAITITAASARVGVAGYRYSQGTATSADGIDAFLATIEAGIGAISIVKVKLTGAKAVINSADEASLIAKQLGRSTDDVLKNGLSKADLEKLVGDIPELRRMRGSNPIDELTPGANRIARSNPCKILGLTGGADCKVIETLQAGSNLLKKQSHLDHFRNFFTKHFADESSWAEMGFKTAGKVGKKDGDAVISAVKQLHADGKLKYLGEVVDPAFENQGLMHWFRDEFGNLVRVRSADNAISTIYEAGNRNADRVMDALSSLN